MPKLPACVTNKEGGIVLKARFNELLAALLADHRNGADGGLSESSRKYAYAMAKDLRDYALGT